MAWTCICEHATGKINSYHYYVFFYVSVLITCPTFAFYSNTLPPFARGSAMEPLRARSTQLARPKRESAAAASGDKAAEDRASGPAKQNRCHYITVRIPKT